MIDINLLPVELRPKETSNDFRIKIVIFSLALFIILFHIILFISLLFNKFQYNILYKKWLANKEKIEKVESWKKENQKIKQDYQLINKLLQQRILIYPKLNALSKNIMDGIWFKHLKIKSKEFKLEGSVFSQEDQHIVIFRNFCDKLKQDIDFSKDFATFEIGPLKTRKISNYEILDFIIEAKLK